MIPSISSLSCRCVAANSVVSVSRCFLVSSRWRRYSMSANAKKVLVPVADGSEEIEAISIINVLRRAGATVTIAGVTDAKSFTGARNISINVDRPLSSVIDDDYDAIVMPGGNKGAEAFRDSSALIKRIRKQMSDGKLVAAICATPAVALATHQILGNVAVGHPSTVDKLTSADGRRLYANAEELAAAGRFAYDKDKRLLTSIGPASSIEFALQCVALLYSFDHAQTVAKPMCVNFQLQQIHPPANAKI